MTISKFTNHIYWKKNNLQAEACNINLQNAAVGKILGRRLKKKKKDFTKPKFAVEVSETVAVVLPVAIEDLRSIHSSLKNLSRGEHFNMGKFVKC